MKTQTPTKRATRCLAASLAIATALATSSAWTATQRFVWKGKSAPGTSSWSDKSCWYYHNGSSWRASDPASPPDTFGYLVYFRDGYTLTNVTKNFADGWDHVVTFSGKQTNSNHMYVDAGSTEDNPFVFAATTDDNGLELESKNLVVGLENANGYLKLTRGTYKMNALQIGAPGSSLTGRLTLDPGDESSVSLTLSASMSLHNGTVAINGGKVTIGGSLHVANNGHGDFILNDGEVDVANIVYFGGVYATDPVLYLNGGTLSTQTITWHNGNTAPSVRFQGGTLRAKKDGTLIVSASDDGSGKGSLSVMIDNNRVGTIDNNGFDVSIDAAIGGTGGMMFKGNGKTTLNDDVAYSGQTVVAPGTTLVVYMNATKDKILNKGLVVEGVPNVGDELFIVTGGPGCTISEEQLAKVACPLAPTTTFELGEGNTNIVVATVEPLLDNYWTGAANDGDLSNPDNWSDGNVPTTGNANIYCTTNSALTKGDTFAPTSITFIAGSAEATINGDFPGIAQIANNSASRVEFTGTVAFSGDVDVVQNSGAVKFTGGATGVRLTRAMDIHGTYNFTQTGDLIELPHTAVKSDGVYSLLNGTFHKHNGDFEVEVGGQVFVKDAKINSGSGANLLGAFNGLFVVTNQFVVSGNNTHYMCKSGSGTFVINELRANRDGKIVPGVKTIMGPDGIIRGAGYVRVMNNGSHEFGSYDDWTMYYNNKGTETATAAPVFYKHSSSTWSDLTFDTTDYYDCTIGRTITCEAPIGAQNASTAAKFRVTVKGKGKFVFANTHDDASDSAKIFSGGLVVQDAATVEVKANAKPGTGTVTLDYGTTFAFVNTASDFSGKPAIALSGNGDGEATIKIDGRKLESGVDHELISSGARGGCAERVTVTGEAIGGRKFKLTEYNGKLILHIFHPGLMIIFR